MSRCTWEDGCGTSSTLSNLFADYDPDKLAHIYIETKRPDTRCCYRFFQISEFSLIHKIWNWRLKTGHSIDIRKEEPLGFSARIADQESRTMDFVRSHRSGFYSFLREVLWMLNGWKSKELREFVREFDPDVIWLDGSPLSLMNRLYDYVLRIAKKPASIFMQDDIYTYEGCEEGFWSRIQRHRLRRTVRRVVDQCSNMFVISPKMKREYDKVFGIDSVLISKSIDIHEIANQNNVLHDPIRMVYVGQVIYGRIFSLISISDILKRINGSGSIIQLSIYTNNRIPDDLRARLQDSGCVFIYPAVPYEKVKQVIADNDIVVFVESFESRFRRVARLSFSTKITDYLAGRKCILAVGPDDSAAIEYFKKEDAALVATSPMEIEKQLIRLSDRSLVEEYAQKAYGCACRNHDRIQMDEKIYGKLIELSTGVDHCSR